MKKVLAVLISILALSIVARPQVTVVQAPVPKFRSFLPSGAPNVAGCVYTFQSGTSAPLNTYTDFTGTTANPNPTILDANGEAPIWISGTTYRFQVWSFGSGVVGSNCGNGSQLYQIDGIRDTGLSAFTSGPIVVAPTNNGIDIFDIIRATDVSASGNFVNLKSFAGTSLFKIDINGNVTGTGSLTFSGGGSLGGTFTGGQTFTGGTKSDAFSVSTRGDRQAISQNPDFEGSSLIPPPGWQVGGVGIGTNATATYETSTPAPNKTQSIKIATAAQFSGLTSVTSFSVVPGDTYSITASAKSDGTGIAVPALFWINAAGTNIGQLNAGSTTSTSWSTLTSNGTVPATAIRAIAVLENSAVTQPSTVWFDQLSIQKTNFPGQILAPTVNATTGFQINGTAPSGHTLIGNGTNYVDAAAITSPQSNTAAVTVNANVTTTQVMQTVTFGAGVFNTLGKIFTIDASGTVTLAVGTTTANLGINANSQATIDVGSIFTGGTNIQAWAVHAVCVVTTTGVSGAAKCTGVGGNSNDISNPPTAGTGAATGSFTINADLTAALTINSVVSFSVASGSNSATSSILVAVPNN